MDQPLVGMQLEQCILRAILTGAAVRTVDAVALALKWDRCDEVVREILFSEGTDINRRNNIATLVTTALTESKLDFIQLFTDLGFVFSEFLTVSRVSYLYQFLMDSHDYARKVFNHTAYKLSTQKDKHAEILSKMVVEDVCEIVYHFCGVKPQEDFLPDDSSADPKTTFKGRHKSSKVLKVTTLI